METVGLPRDDVELHLLTEWGDPASRGRSGVAGVASVLVHIAGLALIVLLPSNFLSSPPEAPQVRPMVTPLVEPLTEFTQPTPTKAKIAKEIDMAALQPRPTIQMPRGAASTTQPMAQGPAAIPSAPQPAPAALPEPPKVEAGKEPPKIELPPTNSALPPPPPTDGQKPQPPQGKCGRAPSPSSHGAKQGGDSDHVGGRGHPPELSRGQPQRRPDGRRSRRRIRRLWRGRQSAPFPGGTGQRAGTEERPHGRGLPPLPDADPRHHSPQLVRRHAGKRQAGPTRQGRTAVCHRQERQRQQGDICLSIRRRRPRQGRRRRHQRLHPVPPAARRVQGRPRRPPAQFRLQRPQTVAQPFSLRPLRVRTGRIRTLERELLLRTMPDSRQIQQPARAVCNCYRVEMISSGTEMIQCKAKQVSSRGSRESVWAAV